MSWNPSPKVAAARDIGKKFDADQVVIVLVKHEAGTLEAISYGRTRTLCDQAKVLADQAYDGVLAYLAGFC